MNLVLPKRQRGRRNTLAEAEYQEQVAAFCALIQQTRSTMDFAVGSRGWCYILERHGLRKGDFNDAQRLINACPKSSALPLRISPPRTSRPPLIEATTTRQEEESSGAAFGDTIPLI